MDAPIKELERLRALQRLGRERLEAGLPLEALAAAEEALGLEAANLPALALKADALERLQRAEEAAGLRERIRLLRRESWQREVEAELRGRHDLLGEAIRHERH